MAQYIPKEALVVEIEKRRNECINSLMTEQVHTLSDMLDFLNTLEVKEVDLDTELEHYKEEQNIRYEEDINMFDFAKHFFELGLKAQHDNWKVVDDTNLPQEDKTKIYCVFTKQRYILAKVISHPQDDDLLQWKCTEFPHHCYDMCEGDRYMQIV